MAETTCQVYETKFDRICSDLLGAEGPVFDKEDNFYMVAPEVMKNDSYAGQVLKVNLENGKVCIDTICRCTCTCLTATPPSDNILTVTY